MAFLTMTLKRCAPKRAFNKDKVFSFVSNNHCGRLELVDAPCQLHAERGARARRGGCPEVKSRISHLSRLKWMRLEVLSQYAEKIKHFLSRSPRCLGLGLSLPSCYPPSLSLPRSVTICPSLSPSLTYKHKHKQTCTHAHRDAHSQPYP